MRNKGKIVILSILSLFALTGCNPFPGGSEEFTSRISFNVWDFLATFLAFVVLILVVFFFGYKPIKAYIKKRSDYVEGKIKTAEEREKNSQSLIDEANKNVLESKKEASLIVEKAKEDALKQKTLILEKAKEEAEIEKQKAAEEIAQEIESSKDDIHREIVSVAMDASKKIIGREINDEDNKRLVDEFVKDLNKEDK